MGSRLEKNSDSVRKRIEAHTFEDEEGDEYEGSKFGGFTDYFRRKKIKLQNKDAEVRLSSIGKPQIFRGIVAHVNGYTQPSLNDLHHLIVSHGGGFMQYLDGKTTVTHIIASNLTPKKAIEFKRYRIVKPAWIVDSIAAAKVLPWEGYRVLDEGVGQKLLGFDEGKVVSQANNRQKGYRDQTNNSWYTSQIQNVAEDIDDEDGAQFPSSQVVTMNRMSAYLDERPRQSIEATARKVNLVKEDLNSSFEVTSSLENVLNEVAARHTPIEKNTSQRAAMGTPSRHQNAEQKITRAAHDSPQTPSNYSPIPEKPSEPQNYDAALEPNETEESSPSKKPRILTAEEHNAALLADPRMRKSSTANPDFLKQYYAESRLHHLSTWKADLKSRFQAMASEKSASQRVSPKRKPGSRRFIMHVDFDSFFCAVSLLSAPEYVNKPTVVAHGTGIGSEIASCNYPARAFGVKNGMWMKHALPLCPDIKVLPYDFPAYEEASNSFYEAIIDVGGIVQSVSIDEALVDITALCLSAGGSDGIGMQDESIEREQERADSIASALRKVIKEKTGCAVSIGIGSNILLAKVALRKAKPAGQHQIKPEEALEFLAELKLTDLPGVAYSISGKLEEAGVILVKDVRLLTKERLMTILGPKTGEKIWDYARGIDRTEVGEQVVRKSVSAEVNWGIRFISQPEAEEFVKNLCVELQRRLVDQKVKGRQLTMKIMKKAADAPLDPPKHLGHGKCDTHNKSIVLGVATNSAEVTGREAVSILRSYGFSPGELRGLGVQMTKLESLKISDTLPDGSQRRITFGKSAPPKLAKRVTEDPIDDPETPKAQRITPRYSSTKAVQDPIDYSITPQKLKPFINRLLDNDPIDEINSPKKSKSTPVHPAVAIARANAADSSAKKLNLTGTQFILPTQVDPSVLAELPPDIRSRLLAQSKSRPTPISRSHSPAYESRSKSPKAEVPLPSQFDPEVFAALPKDMKDEVLALYPRRAPQIRAQSLLPQSPRKQKSLPPKKWTPTKKRGRPPGAKNRTADPNQSNFIRDPYKSKDGAVVEVDINADEELDLDFLSALPEDMRLEIVAEHARKVASRKRGALAIAAPKRKRPPEPPQVGGRRLKLPPRDLRPTFTTKELSTLTELRDTVGAWFEEFRDDGPHEEDVGAMERYLRRVVGEERDLGKVVGVLRWVRWLVDDADDAGEDGIRAWEEALRAMEDKVQEAVKERGLGRLEL